MEIKQGTAFRAPVRLRNTDGSAMTGVLYSAAQVYVQKQGGASAAKTLVGAGTDWFEIDAVNMPGLYDVLLSTTDSNTPGFLKYTVNPGTGQIFYGLFEIVANIESDTYTALVAAQADITLLRKYEEGRWKVYTSGGDANRMVIFDSDGTTPLIKFDLKDSSGTATTTNPFERVKV